MPERRDHASTRWLRRGLGRVAATSHRHPVVALALALALTAAASLAASRLRIDTDLTNLLPKSFESVRDLEKLEQRFWGIGYIVVIARGADQATLERFADDLAPELDALEGIEYVDYRRPTDFFTKHALYFLPLDDLETVADRLAAREAYERRRNNPMYIDMEDGGEVAPPLDFSDLEHSNADTGDAEWRRAIQGTTPYYVSDDGSMIVLMAKPAHRASRLEDTKTLVHRVEDFLAARSPSFAERYGPDLTVAVTGRHKKRIDQQSQISDDLARGSLLALVLVLLYVFLHFRRLSAILVVMAPLALGLSWAFGFAALSIGVLNILTGFIGALLTGLGIDHGIHLLARYDVLRARGTPPDDAIAETFRGTGHAVLIAGLTTTASFVALSTSEFRAFSEFGVIAAAGLILVVIAYTVALPALLALIDRGRVTAKPAPASSLARAMPRWAPVFFWLFVVGGVGLASQTDRLDFDPDLASLEDSDLESFRLDKEVNRILGYSQTPVIALTPDAASERRAAALLRARKAERGPASGIDFVGSVADMVPTEQPAKRAVLDRIQKVLAKVKPKWLDPEDRERLADLREMAAARPFTRATLPLEVRRQFEGPDAGHAGSHADGTGFVLVFPAVSLSDGQAVRRFASEVRGIQLDGERLVVSGEGMILADVFALVSREAEPVLALTALLVFATLWLLLGSLGDAVLSMIPAVAQMALLAGLLPLAHIALNPLNIVMIPVLFGIGIDGGVHIVTRLREGGTPGEAIGETGRAITGSILTTILGFGALAIANHPGIQSIGFTAIYGLLIGLLTCLVLLPAFLTLIGFPGRRHPWRERLRLDSLRRALFPARGLATVGRAGDSPVAPGTLGALAALPLAWLLASAPPPVAVAVVAALAVASIWIVERYLRTLPAGVQLDPSEVVLDEFVGVLVALAFVPWEAPWVLAAFVLFRVADIVKPWPIGLIDRRVHGGLGVMGDDLVAGLLAGLALLAVRVGLTLG